MYCCQAITEREFRDQKAFQLTSKNREFDKKVLEVCDKRNGSIAISIKGRIRFIRTGKNLPKKYSENVLASAFGKYIDFNKQGFEGI